MDLNPTAIANKLDTNMDPSAAITTLRVDHATITKELARFRACDDLTRSFYCREWSQSIYKRHFAWNAKTQEDVQQQQQQQQQRDSTKGSAASSIKPKKSKVATVCQGLERTIEENGNSLDEQEITIQTVASDIREWITSPSALFTLPDVFSPVELDSFPPSVPMPDHEDDPTYLLDPLLIHKACISLPGHGFQLLKHITRDVLLSHIQPQCHHTRPEFKTPSELEVERRILNDDLATAHQRSLEDAHDLLNKVWRPTLDFLQRMLRLDAQRHQAIGRGCVETASNFCRTHKKLLQGFNEYWTPVVEAHRKSRKTCEELDAAFSEYLGHWQTVADRWQEEFVEVHTQQAEQFAEDFLDFCTQSVTEAAARLKKKVDAGGASREELKGAPQMAREAVIAYINAAIPRLRAQLGHARSMIQHKCKEFPAEIQALEDLWATSQANVVGRLEKAANKEFRKRLKRLEQLHQQLRQMSLAEFHELFPASDFAMVCLRCLELLMMDGELEEAAQLRHYYESCFEPLALELGERRQKLLEEFREGVVTGRRELAGILGRLFLKEGLRIQEENLALKKQEMFLKELGASGGNSAAVEEVGSNGGGGGGKKKNKKKKKKPAGTPTTVAVQHADQASESSSMPGTPTVERSAEEQELPPPPAEDTKEKREAITKSPQPKIPPMQSIHSGERVERPPPPRPSPTGEPATEKKKERERKKANGHAVAPPRDEFPVPIAESVVPASLPPPAPPAPEAPLSPSPSPQHREAQADEKGAMVGGVGEKAVASKETKGTNKALPVEDTPADKIPVASIVNEPQPVSGEQHHLGSGPAAEPTTSSPAPTDQQPTGTGSNLDNVPRAELMALVNSLHAENAQLMATITSMHQEMQGITNRYMEVVNVLREREQQAIHAAEQQQKQIEEAQKYIQALETRLQQLELERRSAAALPSSPMFETLTLGGALPRPGSSCSNVGAGSNAAIGTRDGLAVGSPAFGMRASSTSSAPGTVSNGLGSYTPAAPSEHAPVSSSTSSTSATPLAAPSSVQNPASQITHPPGLSSYFSHPLTDTHAALHSPFGTGSSIWSTSSSVPLSRYGSSGGQGPPGFARRVGGSVRCGNCGGVGHVSAECTDACRYCGVRGAHLSEACPMQL
ncbi:uncharacterized protein VTP21DRAFT_5390 [Calcarisporiella thermophila]|uniref:uncharacterized protein n=1 Tax=Calcarisporiella thermophila TaxID=911321 RepID=UPI0037431F51